MPPILFGVSLGLPFLAMAVGGKIVWRAATPLDVPPRINAEIIIGAAAVLLTTAALIIGTIAMRVRGEDWRLPLATWSSAAAMALLCVLAIASDDLPYLIHPVVDTVIGFALLTAVALTVGCAGWRNPTRGGLAGVAAAMVVGLLFLFAAASVPFSRYDVALVTIPAGLLGGFVLYRSAKSDRAWRFGGLLIGAAGCSGAMVGMALLIIRPWRLTQGQTTLAWLLPTGVLALMLLGPVVGFLSRRMRLSRG